MQHAGRTTTRLLKPSRNPRISQRVNTRVPQRQLLTLAIETSCDDTCVAVLETRDDKLLESKAARGHDKPPTRNNNQACTAITTHSPTPLARLHFNEKITAKNSGLGGIHPLEALGSHRTNLAKLVDRALLALPVVTKASIGQANQIVCRDGAVRRKPDFVSVTRGPGMRANLLCGLELAKGLAVAWQVPILGVHHMQAHALTPRFIQATESRDETLTYQPDFPFLTLLVSGGHTMLLYSTGLLEHKILATTADVAIGDALDRTGWLLLSDDIKGKAIDTAFGKYLSQYAFPDAQSFTAWPIAKTRKAEIGKPLNEFGWQMQAPLSETRDMAFSFGSLESRVEGILNQREKFLQSPLSADERLLLARTAIGTAFEHLGSRTVIALENLKKQGISLQNLVVSGGVAANDFLRYYLRTLLTARGYDHVGLVFPPVEYCTDNAAMIGWTGIEMYKAGFSSDLSIDALRKWSMDAEAGDGGIVGVGGWHHGATL